MRLIFTIVITIFCLQINQAQIYEAGLFLGGSNLIGDVGATNYIKPNQVAFGGIIKWNRSARHSFRASLIYSNLEAFDAKSDDPRRKQRNLSYTNNSFIEFSGGIEFTFWDWNLHFYDKQATPYMYTGISLGHHDNYYFDNMGRQVSEDKSSIAWGIPMVLGYKTTIADHFILAFEVGARYTFSDELDGSVANDNYLAEIYGFGNINNNDWYTFTGITLTYTFGRNPCYCGF
jgi:hypothetical protein